MKRPSQGQEQGQEGQLSPEELAAFDEAARQLGATHYAHGPANLFRYYLHVYPNGEGALECARVIFDGQLRLVVSEKNLGLITTDRGREWSPAHLREYTLHRI